MHFDRFDIVEAYYMYMCLYHGGQGSREYKLTSVFHRLRFKPRPCLTDENLSENARMIFDRLASGESSIRDRRP